jgi:putative thioredoxin
MPQQPPPSPRIPTHGAVDLSSLKARRPAPPGAGRGGPPPGARPTTPAAAPGGQKKTPSDYVVDVDEANFQEVVLPASMQVPVIVDFWADWCEPCKQLSPVLEKLAEEYGGRWILAKMDVDANPSLAGAVGVQSLPTVMAVVGGQPIPMFTGALPEPEVRRFIEELLTVAEEAGISGTVALRGEDAEDAEGEPDAGEESPYRFPTALAALARGDVEGAEALYTQALLDYPGDPEAQQGMARIALLKRVYELDPIEIRAAAEAAPVDVEAQMRAADLDAVAGELEHGFQRLIDTVRMTSGADRDAAREHLLVLFEVAGPGDPRVAAARRALANALF